MKKDLETSVRTQTYEARVYDPIVVACLRDERDRAIDLMLNAAEGLHLAEPNRYPTLADGLDSCRATMMLIALRMDAVQYQTVTEILGLAQSVPTASLRDGQMVVEVQSCRPSTHEAD